MEETAVESTETAVEETTPSVTAEGETEVAESQDAEGTETTEEVTEEEGAEQPAEGEEGKHKRPGKPLTERIAEIERNVEAKFSAKIANLEAQLSEVSKAQVASDPDLKPIDYEALNAHFLAVEEQIQSLKLEGRGYEAHKLQKQLDKLDAEIEAHEAKRSEKLTAQTDRQKKEAVALQEQQEMNDAVTLVATEEKLTPAALEKLMIFFENERATKPLVDKQFLEMVKVRGKIGALYWAKEYCEKNMGVKEKREQEKREQAKDKLPPSASATAEQVTLKAEADALYKQLEKDPHNEDLHLKWREAKSKIK